MTFEQALIATAAMYGKVISEFELSIWEKTPALAKCDDETKKRALQAHIENPDNGQFMPKIADIVRLIDGDSKDRAMLAWGKAFNAITQVGQYEDVCFDDGVIHNVIDEMGGWTKFCLMTFDEISYTQDRFCKLYRANSRANKPYPKVLIGISGEQNRLSGQKVAKPVPIGNVEQCRLVYKNGGSQRLNTPNPVANIAEKVALGVA